MKDKIHPEYKETTIVCACGEVIHTRSTKQNIRVEICSKCHPFFTGKQKLVDSAGRVDKFMKRFEKKRKPKAKKAKPAGPGEETQESPPAAPEAPEENA
jgi:large subunit ribosomal protein L31